MYVFRLTLPPRNSNSESNLFIMIEPPERLFSIHKLLLGLRNGDFEFTQTDVIRGLVVGARLVLVRAKVLDLLARVLDFGQAERGRGALEEVA